jgi:hypothetical protein
VQLYGSKTIWALLATAGIVGGLSLAYAQQEQRGATSYLPVDIKESFASIMARMKAAKPDIEKKHADLLDARYDLSNRPPKTRPCREQSPCRRAFAPSCPRRDLGPAGVAKPNGNS